MRRLCVLAPALSLDLSRLEEQRSEARPSARERVADIGREAMPGVSTSNRGNGGGAEVEREWREGSRAPLRRDAGTEAQPFPFMGFGHILFY
jgi:hypothetical protein